MAEYASDLTLHAKLLSRNSRGVLPLASAAAMSLTTASRAWAPLPPGNVKLNTLDYANWPATTTGDVTPVLVPPFPTGSGRRRSSRGTGCRWQLHPRGHNSSGGSDRRRGQAHLDPSSLHRPHEGSVRGREEDRHLRAHVRERTDGSRYRRSRNSNYHFTRGNK